MDEKNSKSVNDFIELNKLENIGGKINASIIADIKKYCEDSGQSVSSVTEEALKLFLKSKGVTITDTLKASPDFYSELSEKIKKGIDSLKKDVNTALFLLQTRQFNSSDMDLEKKIFITLQVIKISYPELKPTMQKNIAKGLVNSESFKELLEKIISSYNDFIRVSLDEIIKNK